MKLRRLLISLTVSELEVGVVVVSSIWGCPGAFLARLASQSCPCSPGLTKLTLLAWPHKAVLARLASQSWPCSPGSQSCPCSSGLTKLSFLTWPHKAVLPRLASQS
ncbi:hypothetical protein ElyMa_006940500 [Elysia marginata]|uniref:Secreted protein n=1 Tax=Elysia marginata TaxID=1093978 RepID=A0AAV4JJX9_9GAST|nr:hypothetical protein ElyMa_006940500 [Elysia marginata]